MRLTEDERKKANMLASMIDCLPHEWPKDQHEIELLCHGYLDRVADNHALRTCIADLEAERDAAQAEIERLRADAKRYRHIRSLGTEQPERFEAVGREAGYTEQQIAEYGIYLRAIRDVLEARKHETTDR